VAGGANAICEPARGAYTSPAGLYPARARPRPPCEPLSLDPPRK